MARKKKARVVLENVELKPQVIGYTNKKKNNVGRVLFIFIAFLLAVYFINDISLFVNNLLGKNTADTIKDAAENKEKDKDKENIEGNEIVFNVFDNNLNITEDDLILNNFNSQNNLLTFNVYNNSDKTVDLSNKNYFIETYSESKTLIDRFKLDINSINSKATVSYNFSISNSFYYIVLTKKNKNDYPVINLENDENGNATLTCIKASDNIVYSFKDNKLYQIKHTISDSNIEAPDYYSRYNSYQNKANSFNNMEGVSATFNGTINGYTAIFTIDLSKANLKSISEKYYYNYQEEAKVVSFEMQTYGFSCN